MGNKPNLNYTVINIICVSVKLQLSSCNHNYYTITNRYLLGDSCISGKLYICVNLLFIESRDTYHLRAITCNTCKLFVRLSLSAKTYHK